MANKIIIGSDHILLKDKEFPLLDDIVLETNTQWTSFSTDLGDVADIGNIIMGWDAANGGVNQGNLFVQTIMDAQRWKKTDPLRFSTRIPLYTITNPKTDVFDIFVAFLGYSILYYDEVTKEYSVPGLNLANLNNYDGREDQDRKKLLDKGRFLTVKIPGVVNFDKVLVEALRPTISKEKTKSGYPLWIILDITFSTLFPANTKMFTDGVVL